MAGEDKRYMTWLREQECCAPGCGNGVFGPHHPRIQVGGSLRGHDHTAIPLCGSGVTGCHGSIGNPILSGTFKGWGRERRQNFEREMITKYRALYAPTSTEDE